MKRSEVAKELDKVIESYRIGYREGFIEDILAAFDDVAIYDDEEGPEVVAEALPVVSKKKAPEVESI